MVLVNICEAKIVDRFLSAIFPNETLSMTVLVIFDVSSLLLLDKQSFLCYSHACQALNFWVDMRDFVVSAIWRHIKDFENSIKTKEQPQTEMPSPTATVFCFVMIMLKNRKNSLRCLCLNMFSAITIDFIFSFPRGRRSFCLLKKCERGCRRRRRHDDKFSSVHCKYFCWELLFASWVCVRVKSCSHS